MPSSKRSPSSSPDASAPRLVVDVSPAVSLPEIPGGWTSTDVSVGTRRFQLEIPASPDAFLDDPQVQQANAESDYMPYWAYLWPASRDMAALVVDEQWPDGTEALELGSGVGLVGIAALAAGLRVTVSDYDATSLLIARHNAELNGVNATATVLLDWRHPETSTLSQFPVILGCDVLYEVTLHDHLLNVLDRHLADDGVCWLGDPGRAAFGSFCDLASSRGYSVAVRNALGLPLANDARNQAAFRLAVLHRHESQERQATN
jgi:predicted nicotinamide N-methyase